MSSLRKCVAIRQEIVVPGKYGIPAIMLALKGSEIKEEDIPVHMYHKQNKKKQLKYKGEITTGTVHAV